jgi:hypothetical protein
MNTYGGEHMEASLLRPFVLSVVFSGIVFCASLAPSAQAGTPEEVQPAPAAVPGPAGGATETALYGIVLSKPLQGFQECPSTFTREGEAGMYHSKRMPDYSASISHPCFQRQLDNYKLIGLPPVTETLKIRWPDGQKPEPCKTVVVSVINGVVHGIGIETQGVDTQERDYSALEATFGQPSFKRTVTVQTRMGASFSAIEALWQRPAGVTVSFRAVDDSLDAGWISAQTPQETARLKAEAAKENEGKPRL